MEIKKVKITDLNPAAYNPRVTLKPGDAEYEKLKVSMKTFGYVEPLVWNQQTGTLVSGHQRLTILKAEGLEEVEVSVVDLPLEKEKALNLALNKIRGDWDDEKLSALLQELGQTDGIDIALTGFDQSEISEIMDRYAEPIDLESEEDREQIQVPITAPGDLIELGLHRILCGDSSKKEDVDRLLGGRKVGLYWSDPPYNVSYDGNNRPSLNPGDQNASEQWRGIANDSLNQKEYEAWLSKVFSNVSDALDKGASFYIWNGHRQFGPMHEMLIGSGFHVSCVITWAKERFALGFGDYNQQTEFCLYGWKEDNGSHRWFGPNNESTLWQIDRDSVIDYVHPTQKALELASRAIRNSSVRGDIVLDTFLGSGTALIAAQSLDRVCYGMELDPRYCDVILRRYIKLVGPDKVDPALVERYTNKEVAYGN